MNQRSAAEIRRDLESRWREYDLTRVMLAGDSSNWRSILTAMEPRRGRIGELYHELAEAERRESENHA